MNAIQINTRWLDRLEGWVEDLTCLAISGSSLVLGIMAIGNMPIA